LVSSPAVVLLDKRESITGEKFLRLKTMFHSGELAEARVIVVTSPIPGDGKSFVSLNLALAFGSDLPSRALLIDADLRRSRIEHFIDPRPPGGLAQLVEGKTTAAEAICRPEGGRVDILTSGGPVRDPVSLLGSAGCRDLFQRFRKEYDRIIVDTPPIIPFTDADVIGQLSDGVLMVVRAGRTPKALYVQALEAIRSTRVLGTVLNGATRNLADRKRYHDEYYHRYYHRKQQ
jgi:capsular exopolysaccharide synthesis family protein